MMLHIRSSRIPILTSRSAVLTEVLARFLAEYDHNVFKEAIWPLRELPKHWCWM